MRNVHKILVGKFEGTRLLGRHWRIQEDNINTDLKEIECEDVD